MIIIEAFFSHPTYTLSVLTGCDCLKAVEEAILQMCENYDEDMSSLKKIFIFIEGEENEKN